MTDERVDHLHQPLCALCVLRTRGRTVILHLGYGVAVWLCEEHADPAFQVRRAGRDFVEALERVWHASGCLTRRRERALAAHLESLRERPPRARPGSYAWVELRREAERLYARGFAPADVAEFLRARHAAGPARLPSASTFGRWHAERRWMTAEAQAH